MIKRKLGKTDLYINPLGFGGIPIQRISKEEAINLIKTAVDKGINFFDSARSYTCSEEYLGLGLIGLRDKVFLATKSMSRTYEEMKNDINASLEKLKTDYIDLYQFHNVSKKEDFEKIISSDGAYKALLEAKEKGIIKHIGITSHSYDFLEYILDSEYNKLFETIQFPYNFIENKSAKLFEKANELNIGTIAMKPFGGGYIDKKDVAVKYLLNDSNLSVLIPGMGSIEELNFNLEASKNIKLSSDDEDYISRTIREAEGTFCHRCGYCLPCTKGIDIPGVFTLENYYDRYGLQDWALKRYENMKIKADACINCKKCISKCPYGLDIPNILKRIHNKFEVE